MSVEGSILFKLRQAVAQGAALASLAAGAGCAQSEPPDDGSTSPDSLPDDGATSPDSLVELPREMLGCWGEYYEGLNDGMYHGQCCVEAHCYTPAGNAKNGWCSFGR